MVVPACPAARLKPTRWSIVMLAISPTNSSSECDGSSESGLLLASSFSVPPFPLVARVDPLDASAAAAATAATTTAANGTSLRRFHMNLASPDRTRSSRATLVESAGVALSREGSAASGVV